MSGFDSGHTRFAILRNSVSDWALASQAFRHGSVALVEALNTTAACRYKSYLDSSPLEHFMLFQPPVPVLPLVRTLEHRDLPDSAPCWPGPARCTVPPPGMGGNEPAKTTEYLHAGISTAQADDGGEGLVTSTWQTAPFTSPSHLL
jgi:hypothetical protein